MPHLLYPLPATGTEYRIINKFEHNEVRDKSDATTEYSQLAEAVVTMRKGFPL
jgi:hypothetical protein